MNVLDILSDVFVEYLSWQQHSQASMTRYSSLPRLHSKKKAMLSATAPSRAFTMRTAAFDAVARSSIDCNCSGAMSVPVPSTVMRSTVGSGRQFRQRVARTARFFHCP